MGFTIEDLINIVGRIKHNCSIVENYYAVVFADGKLTPAEKQALKNTAKQQLGEVYKLLNTIAAAEGVTPPTTSFTEQQLINKGIKLP